MINIKKTTEPAFFTDIKNSPNVHTYDDLPAGCSNNLRGHMLQNEQSISDKKYCVYCEKQLPSHDACYCHLDHVRPQNLSPEKSLDYSNMVVSCNSNGTCGEHKEGKYPDNVINPVEVDPSDYFTFDLMTGELKAKDSDKKIFCEATIKWLNIDNYSLQKFRKNMITVLNTYLKNNPRSEVKSIIESTIFDQPSLIQSFLQQNSLL